MWKVIPIRFGPKEIKKLAAALRKSDNKKGGFAQIIRDLVNNHL
jgi:hypothetical protein